MTKVKLVKRFTLRGGPAFNIGEWVAFEDSLAASLVSQGIGVVVGAYDGPPVHRMIATAPIDKQTIKQRGRPHVNN